MNTQTWPNINRCLIWVMGLIPDTQNCGLRMRRDWRERFSRHRLQRKPLVSDHGIYHGTCVTSGGENVLDIPGACATLPIWQEAHGWVTIIYSIIWIWLLNTVRSRRNDRDFADDFFKCIHLNENAWISIRNSLKFVLVPKVPIDNKPALAQKMA